MTFSYALNSCFIKMNAIYKVAGNKKLPLEKLTLLPLLTEGYIHVLYCMFKGGANKWVQSGRTYIRNSDSNKTGKLSPSF